MKQLIAPLFLFSISLLSFSQQNKFSANKQTVIASIEKHQQELISLSDQVWAFAESALREKQSSKVLADYAEANGFKVTRGEAEMPSGLGEVRVIELRRPRLTAVE